MDLHFFSFIINLSLNLLTRLIKIFSMKKGIHPVPGIFLLVILIFVPVLPSIAQVDFSGNWELDKAKSTMQGPDASYPGKRVLHINQNASVFKMSETYTQEGNPDFNTSEDSFTIGSENTADRFGYSEKTSVKWSTDKKTLVIMVTGVSSKDKNDTYLMTTSFNLSKDERILTEESYMKSNAAGEIKVTKVYIRK